MADSTRERQDSTSGSSSDAEDSDPKADSCSAAGAANSHSSETHGSRTCSTDDSSGCLDCPPNGNSPSASAASASNSACCSVSPALAIRHNKTHSSSQPAAQRTHATLQQNNSWANREQRRLRRMAQADSPTGHTAASQHPLPSSPLVHSALPPAAQAASYATHTTPSMTDTAPIAVSHDSSGGVPAPAALITPPPAAESSDLTIDTPSSNAPQRQNCLSFTSQNRIVTPTLSASCVSHDFELDVVGLSSPLPHADTCDLQGPAEADTPPADEQAHPHPHQHAEMMPFPFACADSGGSGFRIVFNALGSSPPPAHSSPTTLPPQAIAECGHDSA